MELCGTFGRSCRSLELPNDKERSEAHFTATRVGLALISDFAPKAIESREWSEFSTPGCGEMKWSGTGDAQSENTHHRMIRTSILEQADLRSCVWEGFCSSSHSGPTNLMQKWDCWASAHRGTCGQGFCDVFPPVAGNCPINLVHHFGHV